MVVVMQLLEPLNSPKIVSWPCSASTRWGAYSGGEGRKWEGGKGDRREGYSPE